MNEKTRHANHASHFLLMLLAHIIPIGLIIILPAIGLSNLWAVIIPVILFVVLHAWMIRSHVLHN